MQKLVDNGINSIDDKQTQILSEEAKKILDVDKQKQLAKDLNTLL